MEYIHSFMSNLLKILGLTHSFIRLLTRNARLELARPEFPVETRQSSATHVQKTPALRAESAVQLGTCLFFLPVVEFEEICNRLCYYSTSM